MQWKNDENKFAKDMIFEIVRTLMVVEEEKAKKISMRKICDVIDKMFSDILEEE
jgi:hypothetical protein